MNLGEELIYNKFKKIKKNFRLNKKNKKKAKKFGVYKTIVPLSCNEVVIFAIMALL